MEEKREIGQQLGASVYLFTCETFKEKKTLNMNIWEYIINEEIPYGGGRELVMNQLQKGGGIKKNNNNLENGSKHSEVETAL